MALHEASPELALLRKTRPEIAFNATVRHLFTATALWWSNGGGR
ncbi:hypothetical protein ACWEJ6_49180 [Nonomuraea sp. NPDC004702]